MVYDHDAFITKKERETDNKGRTEVTDLGDNWTLVIDYLDDPDALYCFGLPGKTARYAPRDSWYIDRAEGVLYSEVSGAEYYSTWNKGEKYADLYENITVDNEEDIEHDTDLIAEAKRDGWVEDDETEFSWDFDWSLMCEKLTVYGARVLRSDMGTGDRYERGEDRYWVPDAERLEGLSEFDAIQAAESNWDMFEGYGHTWKYIALHAKLYFEGVKVSDNSLGGIEYNYYSFGRDDSERNIEGIIDEQIKPALIATFKSYTATAIAETTAKLTPFDDRAFNKQIERIATLQVAREFDTLTLTRMLGLPIYSDTDWLG
jgi:hypothetical protein